MSDRKKGTRQQTCRMSLCLWSVCMRAALRAAAPGELVYSAILSFTAVSWEREGNRVDGWMDTKDEAYIHFCSYSFCRPFPLTWDNLLTLASNCSISTDMVSNILSWVELFSRGVVSDLKGKIRWKNIKNFYLKQLICNWFLTHIKKHLVLFSCV